MTDNISKQNNLDELLKAIDERLAGAPQDENELREIALELSRVADEARESLQLGLARGADLVSRILELAADSCSGFGDDSLAADELVGFAHESMSTLTQAVKQDGECDEIDSLILLAQEKWSDSLLQLWEEDSVQLDGWDLSTDELEHPLDESDEQTRSDGEAPGNQIELMLAAISDSNSATSQPAADLGSIFAEPAEKRSDSAPVSEKPSSPAGCDADAKQELINDRELLEAYLDDAVRCLSSMEQSALTLEESPEDRDSIEQFCRELHTLKGASATVGLSQLASYLHDLESSLEKVFKDATDVEVELLLDAVDRVRNEIGALKPDASPSPQTECNPSPSSIEASTTKTDFGNLAFNDDTSIRIRAAKLDRLMDMLAELVVLRNRRESHVSEFNLFNEELARCASRLSFAEEQSKIEFGCSAGPVNPFTVNSSSTFTEVAKDITAVSQGMRELQKPVSHDNASISRFIRDFRQELMQLRRIPVSGLFNRLQRAARDAAKSEEKQVQVKIVGEQAGLEQEIQERLFESLLHIVRNSVSHGIESETKRSAAGKPPVGIITLEASSSAQLLIIEVRDDGNGLDYEAVRKRAMEKGLISPDHFPSKNELAKLIFHPGFSTRETASKVSGRGVGMDIVAKTIEQLHGRIEVDSVDGQGTTMRLLIPLRTGIEHVMVFRLAGQLFAIPMQSVTAAKSSKTGADKNISKLSLSTAFSLNGNNQSKSEDVLFLRRSHSLANRNSNDHSLSNKKLALAVDELVGPEEVVVRGLPNLLKNHPLFCGVTLSGSGEKVLLLDSERVLEFCDQNELSQTAESESETLAEKATNKKRALVVDDSLTARKVLVKILHQHGFATVEAGDGIEAIERLHKEKFDIVLTDLDMPRFGGLELLSDIQSGRYCEAPVVVVSGRGEEAFRIKAMEVGAVDYLAKPVSKISITQLLENMQLLPNKPLEGQTR